jgi:DNA polymerase II small subunit
MVLVSIRSEPQPPFPAEIAKPLKNIHNLEIHSNPLWVEIDGVTILMYHGTSLDSIIDAIEPIRNKAYHNPCLGQIQLLKKRHLSPIFGRNKIFPDKEDFMVIDKVPHVMHTGHVHKIGLGTYKGVRLLSTGTFQDTTEFQEKLGHEPSPGKFIVMDLSDGSSKEIDFSQLQ